MIATALGWALLTGALIAGYTVIDARGVRAAPTAASTTDLLLMFGLGLLGFAMRRYDVPIAPVLIGVILGPLAEYNLRDAMGNSGNDPFVLVSSPITIVLYVLLAAGVVWGLLRRRRAASSDF